MYIQTFILERGFCVLILEVFQSYVPNQLSRGQHSITGPQICTTIIKCLILKMAGTLKSPKRTYSVVLSSAPYCHAESPESDEFSMLANVRILNI